jgi:hypothetical protein
MIVSQERMIIDDQTRKNVQELVPKLNSQSESTDYGLNEAERELKKLFKEIIDSDAAAGLDLNQLRTLILQEIEVDTRLVPRFISILMSVFIKEMPGNRTIDLGGTFSQ